MSSVPTEIASTEMLGRGVFDSDKAKGKIFPKSFRERGGFAELSTDRVSIGDKKAIAEHHDQQRSPKTLKGWATLTRDAACSMGRSVIGCEVEGNPWHAHIVLPGTEPLSEEDQQQHALNLAKLAKWEARSADPISPPSPAPP